MIIFIRSAAVTNRFGIRASMRFGSHHEPGYTRMELAFYCTFTDCSEIPYRKTMSENRWHGKGDIQGKKECEWREGDLRMTFLLCRHVAVNCVALNGVALNCVALNGVAGLQAS